MEFTHPPKPRWTLETLLYLLAILLALVLRLLRLGRPALSDYEATWAMQALSLARGQPLALGPQPAYLMITSGLFFILGDANFLARLFPALAGSLLPLAPYFFRRPLGRAAALILAFGLAIDPGLVAASRLAGGPAPAVAFGLLALGLALSCRPAWAGICAGLALLSGPAILPGALGIALAWGFTRLLERDGALPPVTLNNSFISLPAQSTPEQPAGQGEQDAYYPPGFWKRALLFFAGTLLIVATLFLRYPQGLGALADTLSSYLQGYTVPQSVTLLRLPAALLVYQPLVVILGIAGAIRSWLRADAASHLGRRLSLWLLFALFLALVYPARQVVDLAWALVPLWALAAIFAVQFIPWRTAEEPETEAAGSVVLPIVAGVQALLLLILFAFAWLNLAAVGSGGQAPGVDALRLALFLCLGALLMTVVIVFLVAFEWNLRTALTGLVWGMSIALGLYMLAGLWSVSQARAGRGLELWDPSPAQGDAADLESTLTNLSEWHTGQARNLDVAVLANYPSLNWALRNWINVRYVDSLAPGDLPSVILAVRSQESPSLQASYRGEAFNWLVYPDWQGSLPPNLPRWLAFRDAPQQAIQLVLWARTDIFPGGSGAPPAAP